MFVSPEVKRIVIISHKHGIRVLLHQLPNELKLRSLGNQEISRRCQNFMNCSVVLSLAPKIKILSILAKILAKLKLNFSRRCYFTEKLQFVINISARIVSAKSILLVTHHPSPSNLICLTILVTLRALIQFQPKIRATNWQKSVKICFS